MEHENLEKMFSTTPMLPKEEGGEKVIILSANNARVGKILVREDTILAMTGCAGCRNKFACSVNNQCSPLLWGKPSTKKLFCMLVGFLLLFALSFVGTILFCFTDAFNAAVLSNMVLSENSTAYNMWKTPLVKPTMKVYVFNYTNVNEVRENNSIKLRVAELGPYVYTQSLERVNIVFENDQLSYQETNTFDYEPEKSNGAHYDQVVVPNLPLLGVISMVHNENSFTQISVNLAINGADHREAFLKVPVNQFLWGYQDRIISTVQPFLSLAGKMQFSNFGLLATKNGTQNDRLTINTGINDINKMNVIEKLNGDTQLHYWGSSDCNSIEGTDGTMFPPALLDRKTILHIFFPNLCRRVPFVFVKDVETPDGVQLLRYAMPKDVFDHPDNNPGNQCFCDDSGSCPPQGIVNVSSCVMGAPVLASLPHFYHGDPTLRSSIDGLHPDENKHISFLDLHPRLGIALQGKSSLQLNIQVQKSGYFPAVGFLEKDIILPIAWIEMTVEELPESIQSLVYHGTYSTVAVHLGLATASIICLIVSGLCLGVTLIRWKRQPCAVIKKTDVDNELK